MARKTKAQKKAEEEAKKLAKQKKEDENLETSIEEQEEVKSEFQLNKQNKYLVKAFKESEYYNKDISNKELEERFNKFKQE